MQPIDTWYRIRKESDVDSPALLVFPERIKQNIALLKSMIDDPKRLRPHVKTHKTKEILQLQLDAGITKFKCATLAEAEMLGECGTPDVLLAYPLYGPKLSLFLSLKQKFPKTKFSAIVDHPEAADALSAAAVQEGTLVDVYVDLNIGMGRTGIKPGAEALALYRQCGQLEGLAIQGFHAYDGHVHERDIEKRKVICARNFEAVDQLMQQVQQAGFPKPRVVIGGSPSFPVYAAYPDVECSPGTFVLWDKGYADGLPDQPFLPAAVLLTRIVSMPDVNRLCVDLGHKAVAAENPLERRVYFLNAPDLKPISQSEEHLVLEAPSGHSWKVGDVLYGLPYHICPTVALYNYLMVIEQGTYVGRWAVASRNRLSKVNDL
ncbi:threonine aldolase [Parapedobacter defluvii]|uniref:Threonine aldolase n=1 Tax=Parapedobacter defluvii TaxID=2045106 RepID=A0ABQ1KXX4_9SPHI|nr:D-TA family PLP-dependent enzyme [Parapedobacter defluvii]GGC13831.1 threonine aldolase [Parapedobacter defluvii]